MLRFSSSVQRLSEAVLCLGLLLDFWVHACLRQAAKLTIARGHLKEVENNRYGSAGEKEDGRRAETAAA